MKRHSYPFGRNDENVQKPKIPIKVTNPETGEFLRLNALLDSGADCCLIPAMVARTIGLKLDSNSECKSGTVGISGVTLKTWKHIVSVQLLDKDWKETKIEFSIISSTIDAKIRVPAIVGTHLFLDKFKITLDYPNDTIIVDY